MGICLGKSGSHGDSDDIEFRAGNVHAITSKESWDKKIAEANKDGKLVVANFSASWCGPCRMMAPVYAELSEKYPSLMFLTIDVDELMVYNRECGYKLKDMQKVSRAFCKDFSSSWDIHATPTFFFLKDGQQLDKLVGANKPELENKLNMVIKSSSQCSK